MPACLRPGATTPLQAQAAASASSLAALAASTAAANSLANNDAGSAVWPLETTDTDLEVLDII